jgi:hypothetical protein
LQPKAERGTKIKNGVQQKMKAPTTMERVRAARCSWTYFIICRDFSLTFSFFFAMRGVEESEASLVKGSSRGV